MSDYTPTTGEIRQSYTNEPCGDDACTLGEVKSAEFDRWLASVKAEAFREAANLARHFWTGTTNLPDLDDPENVAYSFDRWLDHLADREDS